MGPHLSEARRQYHAGTVVPLATLVEAALSEALNEDVKLNMRRGKATDSATLARAISSLTSSGMGLEDSDHLGRAMRTAGGYFSPYFFDSLDPTESVKHAVDGILRRFPRDERPCGACHREFLTTTKRHYFCQRRAGIDD